MNRYVKNMRKCICRNCLINWLCEQICETSLIWFLQWKYWGADYAEQLLIGYFSSNGNKGVRFQGGGMVVLFTIHWFCIQIGYISSGVCSSVGGLDVLTNKF